MDMKQVSNVWSSQIYKFRWIWQHKIKKNQWKYQNLIKENNWKHSNKIRIQRKRDTNLPFNLWGLVFSSYRSLIFNADLLWPLMTFKQPTTDSYSKKSCQPWKTFSLTQKTKYQFLHPKILYLKNHNFVQFRHIARAGKKMQISHEEALYFPRNPLWSWTQSRGSELRGWASISPLENKFE